jgi:hypothetical protein
VFVQQTTGMNHAWSSDGIPKAVFREMRALQQLEHENVGPLSPLTPGDRFLMGLCRGRLSGCSMSTL